MQILFIGRTPASQAGKAGSTPVICLPLWKHSSAGMSVRLTRERSGVRASLLPFFCAFFRFDFFAGYELSAFITKKYLNVHKNYSFCTSCFRKDGVSMMSNKPIVPTPPREIYDDDNIPEIDLPQDSWITEPLPESSRPRKDGPGGDGSDR